MSDEEVEVLLKEIDITKIEDRDSQEVVGYFETLDLISESHEDIEINVNSLKNLHNVLLKFSKKDEWHKGDYKQHSNKLRLLNSLAFLFIAIIAASKPKTSCFKLSNNFNLFQ